MRPLQFSHGECDTEGITDVTATFSAIERESAKMGQAVKTKYMWTSEVVPRVESQITANSYNFDVVKKFRTAINTNNGVSLKIQRRVTLGNRCYFGLNRQLSSRDPSRVTKLTLYKALILPVLLWR